MLRTGLERALEDPPAMLRDARAFGLLSNQASLTRDFRYAADAVHERFPDTLRALFGPQHGLWSTEQDNMIETAHATYRGLPVHSLYSETRQPTDAMLAGLDLMVVDLQDVGTRVYTYVWTLLLTMRACAANDIPVLVLDRPNPLGGDVAEGQLLDLRFESFVGMAAVPMRHGLTIGELARLVNDTQSIGCTLEVHAIDGWQRSMLWPDTGLPWVPPSPNLPRSEGGIVYPGQVLLEGTNVSEGRGTTTPFEQCGAPWIDAARLAEALPDPDGAILRAVQFEPTFQKHHGHTCGGLFVHVTDPHVFRSYRFTLQLLRELRRLWPDRFAWNPPPYEYEATLPPIDILTGGEHVRRFVDDDGDDLDRLAAAPSDWWTTVAPCLLYPR